jgi:hypothetical protein
MTVAALACPPSNARNYALVIGVSKYPSLPEAHWLEGAGNDALSVAAFLREHGFEDRDITVLTESKTASRIRISGAPTRAAILQALQSLATTAAPGDIVYLHFSGHGSLQPASKTVKGGAVFKKNGLDEIFLPRDIGTWDKEIQAVKYALTDDELLDAMTRIRNAGAFVWAVFDSCNSGDIARGAPSPEHQRRVEMTELGIPDAAVRQAEQSSQDLPAGQGSAKSASGVPSFLEDPRIPLSSHAGSMVVFSAAQSYETAPEDLLRLANGDAAWHGLFTYTLLQTLEQYPGLTYRQIAQQIVARYSAMQRTTPTPVFQGDLDVRALGARGDPAPPQWRVDTEDGQPYVMAGALADLGAGSIVALLDQPAEATEQALGFAQVVSPGSDRSLLRPYEYNNKPAPTIDALPPTTYARLIQRSYAMTLTVARPCDARMSPAGPVTPPIPCKSTDQEVNETVAALEGGDQGLIHWVDAGDPGAQIRLVVADSQLWLTPPSGDLVRGSTPALPILKDTQTFQSSVQAALRRIAKATNLLTLSTDTTDSATAVGVSVLARPPGAASQFAPLQFTERPDVLSGTDLRIDLTNESDVPLDVTVLYIDARWGITALYPQTSGRNNRIEAHAHDRIGGGGLNGKLTINADPAGTEHLLVIAVPARQQDLLTDYSFLAQPSLPVSRGGASTPLKELLTRAGFIGGVTRGIDLSGGGDKFFFNELTFRTVKAANPSP